MIRKESVTEQWSGQMSCIITAGNSTSAALMFYLGDGMVLFVRLKTGNGSQNVVTADKVCDGFGCKPIFKSDFLCQGLKLASVSTNKTMLWYMNNPSSDEGIKFKQ